MKSPATTEVVALDDFSSALVSEDELEKAALDPKNDTKNTTSRRRCTVTSLALMLTGTIALLVGGIVAWRLAAPKIGASDSLPVISAAAMRDTSIALAAPGANAIQYGYYQLLNGSIVEVPFQHNHWNLTKASVVATRASDRSPLAATAYDMNGTTYVRAHSLHDRLLINS